VGERENSYKSSGARAIIKFACGLQIAEIVWRHFICDHSITQHKWLMGMLCVHYLNNKCANKLPIG